MNGCIIPGTPIAVDFWQAQRYAGIKLFFLTHLHGDHVVGLTSSWRQPIYCSPVTAQLLTQRYDLDPSIIRTLEVGQSHLVHCCQGHCVLSAVSGGGQDKPSGSEELSRTQLAKNACCDFVSVTVIDANHCAGAVMFLFEGRFGKILHTGDFRYSEKMFEEGSPLSKHVGTIDTVYLDNTYCSPSCVFPSRVDVLDHIVDIVKKHEDCDVVFGVRGLGKEELLVAVALALEEWINVPPATLSFVTAVGLPNVFQTGHPDSRLRVAPFHTVSGDFVRQLNKTKPTIVVLPTALYQGIGGEPYANIPEVFVVPYSDHSSYPELIQFVSKLRPVCVKPIVHGKVRGPFGVDVSSREDMSCFRKYLTKRCRPAVSDSGGSNANHSSTAPRGQRCGFEDLFPDFQGLPSKRRKAVNRAPRKTLCPKGVSYMSDDDLEQEGAPKKIKKTEKTQIVCTQDNLTILEQASCNQHGLDKQKQAAIGQQNFEKDSPSSMPTASLKKAAGVSIKNNTRKKASDEDSQCSTSSLEGKDNCRPVEPVSLKNRTPPKSVCVQGSTKDLKYPSPQCGHDNRADTEISPAAKSNQEHASSHKKQTDASSACKMTHFFKSGCENLHPPTSTHTRSTHAKRKKCREEDCLSSVSGSPVRQKTSRKAPLSPHGQSTHYNRSHTAQSFRSVDVGTLIQKYFMHKNGGKSDVSGEQQRAKLMDTYNSIFRPRQPLRRTLNQDARLKGISKTKAKAKLSDAGDGSSPHLRL